MTTIRLYEACSTTATVETYATADQATRRVQAWVTDTASGQRQYRRQVGTDVVRYWLGHGEREALVYAEGAWCA